MDVLHFIFSSFWVFLGTTILVEEICRGIALIIRELRK